MSEYPEHDKLSAIQKESQWLGELLDWLEEQGLVICKSVKREKPCPECSDRFGNPAGLDDEPCDYCDNNRYIPVDHDYGFTPAHMGINELLAKFYKIDLKKIDKEKDTMLKTMRELNND